MFFLNNADMTIALYIGCIATGAYLMKRNGLSWIEGALWGGFLNLIGLVVIFFRIRSNNKKRDQVTNVVPESSPSSELASDSSVQSLDEVSHVKDFLSRLITKQLLLGLAWWSGSALAMYFALQSTGSTVYWYGGALGSLFHWYRVFKIGTIAKNEKIRIFERNQLILMTVTALLVVISSSKIVPEYFRIQSPTVGTCWTETDNSKYVPVACWSSKVKAKTSSFSDTAEGCGAQAYFDPSTRESRYTCLDTFNGQTATA
jgi:hypothetical protein